MHKALIQYPIVMTDLLSTVSRITMLSIRGYKQPLVPKMASKPYKLQIQASDLKQSA